MKKEYAEEVAARIIEQLEQGTAPWQKPWQPGELRLPYNPTTGKEYRGMNSLWLYAQGHSDPRWMTYNQASAEGGQVRRGSKGTQIVYWKFSEERKATDEQGRPLIDPETGKQKTVTVQLERPRSFMAVVFNGSQIDGLPPLETRPTGPEPERHARAEAILTNSGANIRHEPGDRAFYRLATDSITLPERNQFSTADNYYATALHELGHWTGHPSRLDRDLGHPFGSEAYAREELRAEIASLMLGERLEIGHDPDQHAAYVGSWIKVLKEDPKEIFRAASDAERITSYVMGFEQEQAQLIERQPVQQANELPSGQEHEAVVSQGLPQAQGAPVPVAWRHEACLKFDEEMAARTGDQSYDKASKIAWMLNQYDEMGFEPSEREQAILAEQKPAMEEAAKWVHDNVLLNPVVKEKVYETVRDLGRYEGDVAQDKELREYLEEMAGKQRAQQTQQDQQAYTVQNRRTVPENAAQHAGLQAVYVQLDDGRKAWGFGATDEAAEQSAVERAQRVGLDADRVPTRAVLHEQPEKPMQSRTYLAVPYAEKNQAKAQGAKWDKEAKSWYAPEGVDVATSGLARWSVDKTHVITASAPKPAIEQFKDALKDAGLLLKGEVVTDGKMQRVPVDSDRGGATSGAYAYHEAGRTPGGFIQNYKTGEVVHWKPEGKTPELSAADRARQAAEAAELRKARDASRQSEHGATAAAAQALWNEAPPATADNAYCKAKGIVNPVGLRVVPDSVSPATAAHGIKIAKTAKEAKAMREADPANRVFKAGDLLIPGTDGEGKLWTLQSVNPYFKSFMKGGRKAGLYTVAGAADPQKALAQGGDLVLAEGYATADTVSRLQGGKPVIVAFDSGNLDAVATELRERYPSRPLLIAADNDHNAPKELDANGKPKANVGLVKATETAEKHGGGVMVPQFKDGEKGSDWNDIAGSQGDEAARRMLAEQMAVAKRDAAITAERLTTLARTRDMEARNDPTTSADDAAVATERGHAAEVLAGAQSSLSEVRSMAADGVIGGTKGAPRSAAAVKAGVDRKTAAMHDRAKEEREEVLNHGQTKPLDGVGAGVSWRKLPEQAKQALIADVKNGKDVTLPKDAPAKLKQLAGLEPTATSRPRSRGLEADI
ncbi:zincin-like metallopeptidase domain-containing protein [Aeromonas caviae]|uniref:zincin-like metallopeptidase domain-containing protein n=1 Tax=Aeromonas caviae TaxID=648 RepID=UPI0029DE5469|nr:zincin-like metallopeptidase domain-containing protein [Aeromonas caviae]MDX7643852.1 zincin-like metallopeptidase domain-containing protein [Aeromonas caviae]